MSYQPIQQPGPPVAVTPETPKKRRRWIAPVAAAVALFIGVGIGASGKDKSTDATTSPASTVTVTTTAKADPGPAVTVTANAKPATTVTATARPVPAVTVTKTVSAAPVDPPAAASAIQDDGTFFVGGDVAAGTYKSTGGGGCYWARLKDTNGDLDSILASNFGGGSQIVTLKSSDAAFTTNGCGAWTKVR